MKSKDCLAGPGIGLWKSGSWVTSQSGGEVGIKADTNIWCRITLWGWREPHSCTRQPAPSNSALWDPSRKMRRIRKRRIHCQTLFLQGNNWVNYAAEYDIAIGKNIRGPSQVETMKFVSLSQYVLSRTCIPTWHLSKHQQRHNDTRKAALNQNL